MPDIEGFLNKQRQIQEENEKRLKDLFEDFLAELNSSKDLVTILKHKFNQDQSKRLVELFQAFLEADSAKAQSKEELDLIWSPIWKLNFHEPIYLFPIVRIYEERMKELERQ